MRMDESRFQGMYVKNIGILFMSVAHQGQVC
jgi:hypothetical protein